MNQKRQSLAGRLTRRILIWATCIALGLSLLLLHFEAKATREFYAEIYHHKMLITNEYTRRVISDVYVAVTNNIYYLEHALDNPDAHKEMMARIVQSGTRVRSCGISFIEDYYYPQKGHRFCPFAWRNIANPDVIYAEDMGDTALDYLNADWFRNIIDSDSAQWSDPFYDGYDQTTTLSAYMVPIHDQTGRTVAVLGADISLDWLTNKLSELDSTISQKSMLIADMFHIKPTSYLVNHDGTYITNAEEKHILEENFFSHLESCRGSDVEALVHNMRNGIARTHSSQDRFTYNGQECFVFYTPVKYTNWILATVVPSHAIDAVSYLNGVTVVIIIILALLFLVLVVYYYIKVGIAPLKRLSVSAYEITQGDFDTPMPRMKYNDEICQLRDSIENMQYELSNYIDEVKRTKAPDHTEEGKGNGFSQKSI